VNIYIAHYHFEEISSALTTKGDIIQQHIDTQSV